MTKNFVQLSFNDFDFLVLESYVVASIFVELNKNQILHNNFEQNISVDFNNEKVFCFNFLSVLKNFDSECFENENKTQNFFYNVLILNTCDFKNLPSTYKKNKYFGIILSTAPIVKDFQLNSFSLPKGSFGNFLSSNGILATRFVKTEKEKIQYFVDLDKLLNKEWSLCA